MHRSINAWMQRPVGVEFSASGVRLTSLLEVFANPFAHTKIAHTLSASVLTGAFFMLVVAGAYLLKRRHLPVARVSMRAALAMGLVGVLATLHTGHESALDVAEQQPMKFAAMEAHWSSASDDAPLVLWGWPDMAGQTNHGALELPGAMGALVGGASPLGVKELTIQAKELIDPPCLAARRTGRGGGLARPLPAGRTPARRQMAIAERRRSPDAGR